MPLSDLKIKATKPAAKPYKLSDGGGLFILIQPNGSKLWRLKYRFSGKEKVYAVGKYPLISLAEAREIRDKVKKTIMEGRDPTQQRRLEMMRRMEAGENTFEAVARRWLAIKDTIETHRDRSLRRLELHAFPRLGARPIGEIKTLELALCLEAVEKGGILETAHRVKQLIQQVFRYAIRRGIIEHNPAGDLRDIIGHAPVQNFACIAPSELPQLMRDIHSYDGDLLTISALKLLALTFVRTGELIGARWAEVDWAREEWRIPAERMKMRRDHVVPLSTQALVILRELQGVTGRRDFVFFSAANKDKHISNNAALSALKRMGYNGRMTGHGFRALASTVLNEQRKYHPDIIEKQLAHADRNEIRAAYNRADYLLERKAMMQGWADYLDAQIHARDNVIEPGFQARQRN